MHRSPRAVGRVWLFDLDNTLHHAGASAFPLLDAAMNAYIAQALQVDDARADGLRRAYWRTHGATVVGLVRHHGIDAAHFLEHTHALPSLERRLVAHPRDLAALRRLPGRKYVVTNAPSAYARRVLRHFGLHTAFDGVLGVEDLRLFGRWRPKPDVRMLQALAARLKVSPRHCIFVEDSLSNQRAAHCAGMRAVWMQRWLRGSLHGPEVGVYLHRRPAYVCARIVSLQQLRRVL